MTSFGKNFIISLPLLVSFFLPSIWCWEAVSGAEGQRNPEGPTLTSSKKGIRVSIKKKSGRKIASSRTDRKKIKKGRVRKTVKKKRPAPKARSSSPTRSQRMVYTVPPSPPWEKGAALQGLVEKEIAHLRSVGHLLAEDEISLQVYDLQKKKMLVDVNGRAIRNAASLIKVFVMLAVYEAVARQEMTETPELDHLLHRMIAVSDNESTNVLIRRLGKGDAVQGMIGVNAILKKLGFEDTRIRELIPEGGRTYANETSAHDNTLFFRLLYEQRLVSPFYSQKMNEILLKSIHDRIKTQKLDKDGVLVADKTGFVRGLNGDCGIVYQKEKTGGNDYILSVIIENKKRPDDFSWGRKKSHVIRHLSNRIYQYMKNGETAG